MAAAAIVQVFPAPTTCASSVLPLCTIRQTASFWWRRQVAVAQMLAVHAGQGQMRAVEAAQAQIVEAVVVFAGQPRCARAVLPDPLPEAVLQLLLFFARGDGLLLIDDPRSVLVLVIGGRHAAIERLLDQLGGAKARRAVRRRVGDVVFLAASRSRPSRSRWARRAPTRTLRGRVSSSAPTKSRMSRCRNPRRPEAGLDVARLQVGGLHGLQRLDIALVRRDRVPPPPWLSPACGARRRSDTGRRFPTGRLPDCSRRGCPARAATPARCGRSPAPCAASAISPVSFSETASASAAVSTCATGLIALQRPPLEDGRLGGALRLGIVVFKGE